MTRSDRERDDSKRKFKLLGPCFQKARRLVQRFLPFTLGNAVSDDAGADMKANLIFIFDGCADGNVPLAGAIKTEVTYSTGIETSRMGFKLADDFKCPFFRCTTDTAAWETGAEGMGVIDLRSQGASNG